MPAKTLMIQGTASSVGKSIIVSALCRILRQDGYKVAPFKSQNMALNSFVTREGGEIGRAQAVQAEAAGIQPTVDMNPILLKPEADSRSQVVVMGKVWKNLPAREYYDHTGYLTGIIQGSLDRLSAEYDVIVIEGAGSPAEINLQEREIVNMKVARMAKAPVLLVGDIDRGGVFASIVGTIELLPESDRDLVRGFVINKFRGDVSLLKPGLDFLEKKTGKPVLGVVPFFKGLRIAQEDSVWLEDKLDAAASTGIDVAVIGLPHIANYDDFDPLEDAGFTVRFVASAQQIGSPDLIILPGTKTTMADLNAIRANGLAQVIKRRVESGTPLIGICGGFQMIGKKIYDPGHTESKEDNADGLGLLDIETTFAGEKTTSQVKARFLAGSGLLQGLENVEVSGYEIHMGLTKNLNANPVFRIVETPSGKEDYLDGAQSADGDIFGSYIHGLFNDPGFTHSLYDKLSTRKGAMTRPSSMVDKDEQYDELARIVRSSIDVPQIYRIAGLQ
jgi:adenosylcobyric acid synthase